MLRELAGDAQLDRFRAEYEKVFRALKRSHDNEKRLIRRCRELNAEIVSGAAKVQAALALSDEDQGTITALKKEIESSWKMVDSSHEKVGGWVVVWGGGQAGGRARGGARRQVRGGELWGLAAGRRRCLLHAPHSTITYPPSQPPALPPACLSALASSPAPGRS